MFSSYGTSSSYGGLFGTRPAFGEPDFGRPARTHSLEYSEENFASPCEYEVQNKERYFQVRETTQIYHSGGTVKLDHITICLSCLKYMVAENKRLERINDAYVEDLEEKEGQLEDLEEELKVNLRKLVINKYRCR